MPSSAHTCPHLHTHALICIHMVVHCTVWVYGQRLCSSDIARFAPNMHTQPSSVAACGFGMKPQPQYICFGLCYAWCGKWGGGLSYHIGGYFGEGIEYQQKQIACFENYGVRDGGTLSVALIGTHCRPPHTGRPTLHHITLTARF